MRIEIDSELADIFNDILTRNLKIEEWREIESCDEFQSPKFCGGFDATEDEFCFSYYDDNNKEYWFQISLEKIEQASTGNLKEIAARPAEI